MQGMGQYVGGGFAPGHELAVVPDETVAVGHGHGVISLFRFVVARGAILALSELFMKHKRVNKKNTI
jgi:hypothetical protein